MLLTAFGIFRAAHADDCLQLLCVGADVRTLAQRVEDMHLQARVVLAEPSDELPLDALYANCAAVVYPSLHEEVGLGVRDALASGAPVIASRNGCLPEMLGDAGLQVDCRKPFELARAIERAACDEVLRESLGRASFARATALHHEHLRPAADLLQALYEAAAPASSTVQSAHS
jgi:glycosyltransferase involved in cell wall biosynthesis